MATIKRELLPQTAFPAASNGAQHDVVAGSNAPIPVLAFDGGSTNETVFWTVPLLGYGSGTLTLDVYWRPATSTTGTHTARWGAAIASLTANSDTDAVGSSTFGTAVEVNDDVLGTTAGRPHMVQITGLDVTGLANEDILTVQLYRDASNTTDDDLTEDAYVFYCVLSYSDT